MKLSIVVGFFLVFTSYFFLLPLPSPTCAADGKTCRTPPANSASSGKANTVTAPSLADDWLNTEIMMRKVLPENLNQEINESSNSATNSAAPKIGIEQGFVANLLCAAGSIFPSNWFGGVLRDYCIQDIQVAGEYSNNFVAKAKVVSNATQPEEWNTTPVDQDCFIADDPSDKKDIKGNSQLDDLNKDLGTNGGLYGENIPQFPDASPDLKTNLNLDGKTFDEDKRVPDINKRCKEYSQANYPEGISICE